jgi:hypothetical protein
MHVRRGNHHAVVVSGLPNVNDYIDRRNRTRLMALNVDDDDDDDDDDDESISCSVI